jgi:aspartate/methionine/tyrosine aminotransferase
MTGFLSDADLSVNAIELARQRAEQRGYIDLTSSNPTQNGLIFPPQILREAAEPFWSSRIYTPDPRGSLAAREAIARYVNGVGRFERFNFPTCQPKNIFLTASTSEAYSLLFALLTHPGDNVLAPNVSYPLFDHLAAAHHISLKPYTLDESLGWQIDETSLLDAVDERTRAVLMVSPHNPTGAIVSSRLESLATSGLPIICDEVFTEFTRSDTRAPLLASLFPNQPVFTLNGISKMFALPDLKLGWVAMNDIAAERYAARFEILNDAFLGANALSQFMLPTLFERGWGFVSEMTQRVNRSIDFALDMLSQCENIVAHPPAGGYYLFPRVLNWDDEEALTLHLLEHGAHIHPGFFYGDLPNAHIMISCLTEPKMLQLGLQRLIEVIG